MTTGRAVAAAFLLCMAAPAAAQRADAVLVVNSASARYADAQHYIRPYLDHFGVPYTVLDIATTSVGPDIASYALIIIGHASLDPTHAYLDATEQGYLTSAVAQGTGIVNFDYDLTANGSTGRYQYVQDIFGFGYQGAVGYGQGVVFTAAAPGHYVSTWHAAGSTQNTSGMNTAYLAPGPGATVLAEDQYSGSPLLTVKSYGTGHAVQWGTYEWVSHDVLGPLWGLDDLVWRSLVWAARKPFVMRGLPNFLTMRVDDSTGPFWWIDTANQLQLKPWAGVFYVNVSDADAADLSDLVNSGLATASVHARTGADFMYYDHSALRNLPDATVAANFEDATAWHASHGIPISKFVLPHFYELGTNVFGGLNSWGVQFVGTWMEPGLGFYGSPWLNLGPYRLYQTRLADEGFPGAYADYLDVPGHPEYANRFFNCVTEIRDIQYDFAPDNDVAGTVSRATAQGRRAFQSMVLATIFTHEYFIQDVSPANWQAELSGITGNLSSFQPVYVTMDYACQYLRAKHDSPMVAAVFDPVGQTITTDFAGSADVPTQFYVFTAAGQDISQSPAAIPAFTGGTRVVTQLAGALDHVVVTPNPGRVPTGGTLQFSAQGYDAAGNRVAGLTFQWSTTAGTIDQTGRLQAGVLAGIYPGAVSATAGGVTGTAGLEVYSQVLDHFGLAPVTGPVYAGSPFSVRVTAYDQAGNVVSGYTGPAQLRDLTGTLAPTVTGTFTGGSWSGNVTVQNAAAGDAITVSDGVASGTSAPFDVQSPPVGTLTIWPSTVAPTRVDAGADAAVEVGVKFTADVAGTVTGVRFYKASANTGTHVGNLWSGSGQRLASATFADETASGWQQVSFAAPVAISANTVYVVSYHTTGGHYSADLNYFAGAGYDRPPLHAPASGAVGGNGVYAYGSTSQFPSDSYAASNYWVDVVFASGPAPTLSSIAVTPASTTVPAGSTQQFTATGTFSDGSTQDLTSQVTWASSATGVATVAANGLATAVAVGTTTVSATRSGISGTATLTVAPRVASVVVTPASARLVTGATQQFAAAAYDAQGGVIPGVTFSWSATGGGTVTQGGLFTAGSVAGTFASNVVASSGGVSGAASTEVVALSAVSLSPAAVVEGGASTGTVSLSGPAPADLTVGLSSNSAAALVPASVVVPAGATSAAFTVTTTAVSGNTSATITASLDAVSWTATLSVRAAAVTVSPTSVLGGGTATGTVQLGSALSAPVTFSLSSSDPAAAVPASVTIAAGTTTATFTVTTSPVTINTAVTIAAAYGAASSTAALTVTPPGLGALAVSPAAVVGGDSSTGTVTLTGPAPTGGMAVSLSDSSSAVSVPATMTVPAGATTASFAITTTAVSSGVNATITARLGTASRTAQLSVRRLTLSLSPATVGGGNASTGTVTLSGVVPVATTATLTTSNAAVATVPATVTIAAGATTAAFPIQTSAVTATTTVAITAAHSASSATANLSVRAISPSAVSLSPSNLVGGAPSTGTVTLNYAAPAGGYVVTLTSSRTAVATVPATVTVPAGSTTATFPIVTYPVAGNTSSSITARGGGVNRSATLTVTAAPAATSLRLNPSTISSGGTSTATVTLNGAAPGAGTTVTLTSSNGSAAMVPASVVVPSGATSVSFGVTAGTVTASTAVTISASAGGRTATATLTVNP